jgi:hypothetical protein
VHSSPFGIGENITFQAKGLVDRDTVKVMLVDENSRATSPLKHCGDPSKAKGPHQAGKPFIISPKMAQYSHKVIIRVVCLGFHPPKRRHEDERKHIDVIVQARTKNDNCILESPIIQIISARDKNRKRIASSTLMPPSKKQRLTNDTKPVEHTIQKDNTTIEQTQSSQQNRSNLVTPTQETLDEPNLLEGTFPQDEDDPDFGCSRFDN